MSTNSDSFLPDTRLSRLALVVGCGMLFGALLIVGCNGSKSEQAAPKSQTQAVEVTLDSPLASLQPDEFELNVPRDLPSRELNAWAEVMMTDPAQAGVSDEELTAALKSVLSDEEIQRVLYRQFVERDSVYLRDAYWARTTTELVAKSSKDKSEPERIVELFYYVTDNLPIVPSAEESLPLGPFESLLVGRGSPEVRAWAFSLLMKQLRIPTVVVETDAKSAATGFKPLLVGVLSNGEFLLFDAALGLPIPAANEDASNPRVIQPATLKQVLADDGLLRKLDADENEPYPLKSEQLKTAKLRLIGETSMWARRMEGLQAGLASVKPAVAFEPLVTVESYDGVLNEVQAAAKDMVPAESVSVWPYVEAQREAREHMTEKQILTYKQQRVLLVAPRPLSILVDEKKPQAEQIPELVFGNGWNYLLQARAHQLLGRHGEAIPLYLKLQGWRRIPPTPKGTLPITPQSEPIVLKLISEHAPEMLVFQEQAGSTALFWRASTQLDRGEYQLAASDFESYLTTVVEGPFARPARYLAGVASALNGKQSRGAGFLRRIAKDDPQYFAAKFYIRRWKEKE